MSEKNSNTAIVIRREREDEHRVVENLVREAFWNVYRPGCLEHYVLHRLRTHPDFVPELDLVMEVDGRPNVRTCVTRVREGMIIRTQEGNGHEDL